MQVAKPSLGPPPLPHEAAVPLRPTLSAQRVVQEYAAPWRPPPTAPPAKPLPPQTFQAKRKTGGLGLVWRIVLAIFLLSLVRNCYDTQRTIQRDFHFDSRGFVPTPYPAPLWPPQRPVMPAMPPAPTMPHWREP